MANALWLIVAIAAVLWLLALNGIVGSLATITWFLVIVAIAFALVAFLTRPS